MTRREKLWVLGAVGATLGLLLVGWLIVRLASGEDLQSDDPNGYRACYDLDRFRGDGELAFEENGAVAESATKAKTATIRVAARPIMAQTDLATLREYNPEVSQIYVVNEDEMISACADTGYTFTN